MTCFQTARQVQDAIDDARYQRPIPVGYARELTMPHELEEFFRAYADTVIQED